ncbi:MAG: hypothetical protein JWO15_2317 [Sphingomonadales bacterium]|nr:hypothetical protein [Sphingomonadales bacterium]
MKHSLSLILAALAALTSASSSAKPAAPAPGYHITDRVQMTDGWWDYATFDAANRRLFVARGNGIFKYDVDSGLMDSRFIPGSEGRAVVSQPGTDVMLTTMAGYSAAILFSGGEGKVAKMISLKQASDSAFWEPLGKRFWVMGGAGEASEIDPVTMAVTGSIDLGEPLEFSVTDGRGRFFVNGSESASVIAVDAASRKVVGRWKMKDCEDPSGMAYADAADVILSVCANSMVKVLDARTGEELLTVPVGGGSDAVIYDKATKRAFVPSAFDGMLTVLAVNGPRDVKVLERVRTQIGTRTGAIDSKTGTLYLPTARFGPLNKLGWPEALPGTVQLLVMEPTR